MEIEKKSIEERVMEFLSESTIDLFTHEAYQVGINSYTTAISMSKNHSLEFAKRSALSEICYLKSEKQKLPKKLRVFKFRLFVPRVDLSHVNYILKNWGHEEDVIADDWIEKLNMRISNILLCEMAITCGLPSKSGQFLEIGWFEEDAESKKWRFVKKSSGDWFYGRLGDPITTER